ncbi:MAG: HEAT repeat domain-containing protein [Chloroflexota bacterium]|nr:HEAT repeat domain-containing protein [Chloroflexota bacterium]
MEFDDSIRQTQMPGQPHQEEWSGVWVPASLLSGLMSRVEQQEIYVQRMTEMPSQQLLQSFAHPQWEIRAAALEACGQLAKQGGSFSLDPVVAMLHDEHPLVRVAAVQALGQLGGRVPLDQLIIALRDREWQVREMVVLVLGELVVRGEPAARPLLVAALQDASASVRESAQAALDHYEAQAVAPAPAPVLRSGIHSMDGQSLAATGTVVSPSTPLHAMNHLWLVANRQLALLQKRWWVPACILFLSYVLIVCTSMWFDPSPHHMATVVLLAVAGILSSTLSIGFSADMRHDAGVEIALSTPTSLRSIMFCRFLVVIGLNVLLSLGASAVIALLYGQGFWGSIQLWLGPLLLASSLTLALTMLVGSWLSCLATVLLDVVQLLHIGSGSQGLLLHIPPLWQVLLVTLCLLFAFLYAPRQAGLLREHMEG